MSFYDNGEDMVESHYSVSRHYEGYPGIVHGGVQAAILDEIIGPDFDGLGRICW